MKLHSAILLLKKSKMHVIAEDRTGKQRLVTFTWSVKDTTNTPPSHWPEAVEGEHEYQLEQELAAATGSLIVEAK